MSITHKREINIEKFTGRLEKEETGFTMLLNETLTGIKDVCALGVYCYLASKPPMWNINTKEIGRHFSIGRDKTRNALGYLVKIGALIAGEERSKGKIIEKYYLLRVRLTPAVCVPRPENPSLVKTHKKPAPEKPGPENPSLYKTKRDKTKKKSSSEKITAIAALPPMFLDNLRLADIKPPARVTSAVVRYIERALNALQECGLTYEEYLEYLGERCSFMLLPYESNGVTKQNGFSVIFKPEFIKRAIKGDFEDRK